MAKPLFFKILVCLLFFSSSLFAEGIVVGETAGNGSFPLVSNAIPATLVIDANDAEVVSIVATALKGDIKLITGVEPVIKNTIDSRPPVIIGTLGKSALIDQLAAAGKIDQLKLEGKWETFCISVVNNPLSGVDRALVIAGSDPRGTAFGVFELSRIMGVSPWVWWADVTPESSSAMYVSGDALFGPPSVKYRGMFINDEDFGMKPWAANTMDKTINNGSGDIGPSAHEKIFELMLRTKSNFFWPAMHACTKAFWYYKENPAIARKYAIVLSSSHCEPMLRNNEDEWNRNFKTEYPGVTKGEWNWKTNSTVIRNYWNDRAIESKNTEAVYTMGMRGVHDSQMLGYNTDKERAEALKVIIANQRDILQTNLEKPKETIPQLFCPYKEALLHYNEGIDLPADVTLLWPDDNHGFIRQLSTPEEQARSGGGGVYYHFSYWGPTRQDYLWLSSTSPVKTSFELSKAYDLNAKNIWVFNVGDIKPAEYEYQFAMDLAWDVDAWRPEKAHQYAKFWAKEIFGEVLADEVAAIQKEHYHLSASGRPDQIDWAAFSVAETEKRLSDYAALVEKVKVLEPQVPERLKAAYFQLITYPVQCSAAMNEKILGAKLSFDYARTGKTKEALAIADSAREAYRTIRELTNIYNKVLSNGKWDGMMSYAPKSLGFFYSPQTVTKETMPDYSISSENPEQITEISVKNFQATSGNVKVIEELGVGGASVTVLPFNMTQYTASDITSAPNVEYKVRLKQGENKITVKCLPTFPLYPGLDLRYALSVDGATPRFISIKTLEQEPTWRSNIISGFAKDEITVASDSEKEAILKIYFADPGLVLSAIEVRSTPVDPMTKLIVNPDFEIDRYGNQLSGITRGTPYGWTYKGKIIGNSYGTNQDALNFHGQNACWYSSTPMPSEFELSQVIDGLPAGEYVVRCLLGVPNSRMTTQRLFANKYVQYYGKKTDYVSNLTAGEMNTFAGYTPDFESKSGEMLGLREMALKFIVLDGEKLTLGLRSSNKMGDGTSITDDQSGWFKIDHFRLERVRELTAESTRTLLSDLIAEAEALYDSRKEGTAGGEYPPTACNAFLSGIQAAQTVNQNSAASVEQMVTAIKKLEADIKTFKESIIAFTSYIVNPSFEYKSATELNDGTTFRGKPYGWTQTGTIIGTSFGINKDALNLDGNNVCWYLSNPMPSAFELFQVIKDLPAGEYTIRCRMAVQSKGLLGNQRLFANNDVQYYGYQSAIAKLIPEEKNSFASLDPSYDFTLQEMEVNTVLKKGEDLKLGIRTSNMKSDGTNDLSGSTGWFKVDYFRLELKELHEDTGISMVEKSLFKVIGEKGACQILLENPVESAHVRIISLSGNVVHTSRIKEMKTRIALPRGLYIVAVSVDKQVKTGKVFVL